MLFSVCSFGATGDSTDDANAEILSIMQDEFETFLKKNKLPKDQVSFAYEDFGRDLQFVYNGDRMFEPNDTIKFPIAYVYFKDLASGKFHLYDDVGEENLRTVFLRSLTKDFNRDNHATEMLVEKYGGKETIKRAMYEITYTKVDDVFFETYAVSAQFLIDFLAKYYSEAFYSSSDFKTMLITPLKQFSPGRFSETYIYDCKITHRYGFSRTKKAAVDMGIVNSANPFGIVIQVEGVDDPEEYLAQIAEWAYEFNLNYADLRLSQLTTLPDVPDGEKGNYDARRTYKTPLMITIIVSTVFVAAVVTVVYIVNENRKKSRDRLD